MNHSRTEEALKLINLTFITIIPFEAFIGAIANLICYKIFKSDKYKSLLFKYLAFNSLIDFFSNISVLIYTCFYYFYSDKPDDIFGTKALVCLLYFMRTCFLISSFASITIVIHRFFFLIRHHFCCVFHYKFVIIFSVISSILLELPFLAITLIHKYFLLNQSINTEFRIWFQSNYKTFVSIIALTTALRKVTSALLMFIVTVYMVFKLISYSRHAKSESRNVSMLNNNRNQVRRQIRVPLQAQISRENSKIQRNVTKTIIFISFVFITEQLSNLLIFYFYFGDERKVLYTQMGYSIYGITTTFLHSANILIYYRYDRIFAKILKSYFKFS